MKLPLGLTLGLALVLSAPAALAEDQSITLSTDARIGLVPLSDQTLTESETITVQPRDLGSPDGALSEPLPRHCLLSVDVDLTPDGVVLNPGKMICITEDRRILEGVPEAGIEALGECQSSGDATCDRYRIEAGQTGRLELRSETLLSPQPRNELN